MNSNNYEKIIKDAIKGEAEAELFYLNIAEKLSDEYLRRMFIEFSQEEGRHQVMLAGILSKSNIKGYFHEDRDYKVAETIPAPPLDDIKKPADAFAIAMKNEEAAMNNYMSLAENSSDPEVKKIFEDLAAMERNHKFKMQNAFVDVAYPEIW